MTRDRLERFQHNREMPLINRQSPPENAAHVYKENDTSAR